MREERCWSSRLWEASRGIDIAAVNSPVVFSTLSWCIMRILAVDDSEDTVRALAKLLELKGYEVQLAFDGRSAIDRAADFRPQVILLDIAMPQITGIDVARSIRQLPELQNTVLVAVTGHGDNETRRQMVEVGFDYLIVKPCQPEELHALLEHVHQSHEVGR